MSLMDYDTSPIINDIKYASKEDDTGYIHSNVDPELICSLCNKIMENPYQLGDCGCKFCHECLKNMLTTENSCPNCNEELKNKVKIDFENFFI